MIPPSQEGLKVVLVCLIFNFFATLMLVLRIIARRYTKLGLGTDDVLISVSWIFTLCHCSLSVAESFYGMGRHVQEIPMTDLTAFLKLFYTALIFYNLSLTLTKVSILTQYLRVFVGPLKFRIACWMCIALVSSYGTIMFFITVFTCRPIEFFWNWLIEGHCFNTLPLWYSHAGINIFTDFAILALPMPVLKSLKLSNRKKRWLMFVFAIGGGVCIISIIRIRILQLMSADITWDNVRASIWSNIEGTVAIICGCVPCFKPLIDKVFPNTLGTGAKTGDTRDSEGKFGLGRIRSKTLEQSASLDSPKDTENEAATNHISVTNDFMLMVTAPARTWSVTGSEGGLVNNQQPHALTCD